ncbi:MAG: DUF924 domain-containing protein [Cellvibrionaceae bacterium]
MYQTVLNFWFQEIEPSQWWEKDCHLDELIKERFSCLHKKAMNCELYEWRETAKGRLAEIIILDQFSRNIYRDLPLSFSSDALALALSQEAVSAKANLELSAIENSFLYMPYMHSESITIHTMALKLYEGNGIEANYQFEVKHREIIERFGRYPHRNNILGRESSEEEIEFLKTPGSSF